MSGNNPPAQESPALQMGLDSRHAANAFDLPVTAWECPEDPMHAAASSFIYVGPASPGSAVPAGDGINVYAMDHATGAWRHVQLVGNLVNPSFLSPSTVCVVVSRCCPTAKIIQSAP
jgi:hypothetical protein